MDDRNQPLAIGHLSDQDLLSFHILLTESLENDEFCSGSVYLGRFSLVPRVQDCLLSAIFCLVGLTMGHEHMHTCPSHCGVETTRVHSPRGEEYLPTSPKTQIK